jgi:hypothetical protein
MRDLALDEMELAAGEGLCPAVLHLGTLVGATTAGMVAAFAFAPVAGPYAPAIGLAVALGSGTVGFLAGEFVCGDHAMATTEDIDL